MHTRKRTVRTLVSLFCLSLIATIILAMVQIGPDVKEHQLSTDEYTETWTLDMQPGTNIDITLSAIDVEVESYDGTDIRVDFIGHKPNNAEAQSTPVKVEQNGTHISIKQNESHNAPFSLDWIFWQDWSSKVQVQVPRESMGELKISTASGDINVSGLQAQSVDTYTTSGNCEFAQIQVAASFDCDAVSGDIDVKDCQSVSSNLKTTSGSIYSSAQKANTAKVDSTSGHIDFEASMIDDIVIKTTSSGVELSSTVNAGIQVETVSGAVELDVPQQMGFRYDINTLSGRINVHSQTHGDTSHERGHATGTVGDGSRVVKVNTTSGSVQINTI